MELEIGILLLSDILSSLSSNSDKVLVNVIKKNKLLRPTQCGYTYRFRSSGTLCCVS